jgi:hypothetical protein
MYDNPFRNTAVLKNPAADPIQNRRESISHVTLIDGPEQTAQSPAFSGSVIA